jgi:STE24 endopeptidase
VTTRARERTRLVAVLAVTLAVVGVAATVWRPVAPPLPPGVPDQAVFDATLLDTIAAYRAPRQLLAPLATALGVLVPLLLAVTPWGRRAVGRLVGQRDHAPLRAGLVAAAIAAVTSLVTFPMVAWLGLVHEARWGFRTSTTLGWLRDWAVVATGRWLSVGVTATVLFVALRRWPRSWPYRLTVAATVAAGVLVTAHPVVLQPLLLRTTPLADGAVADAVTPIVEAAGAADTPVLVADASRRTTRVNAHVTGLGPTERIVLYDTLLELPTDHVVAVVAHELAHREHRDLSRGTLLTAAAALPMLLVLRWVLDRRRVRDGVARATGRPLTSPSDPRLVVVVVAVVAVLELVGTPMGNTVSRRVEAAADHRALTLGADPVTSIRTVRTFVVRDLAAPEAPTPLRWLYGTHPSPEQRLRAATAAAERTGVALPGRTTLEVDERDVRHARAGTAP